MRETDVGATVTLATGGGVTVIVAVADFPSTNAVMVTLPGATAVTKPNALMVAIDALELDQATDLPVRTPPLAS